MKQINPNNPIIKQKGAAVLLVSIVLLIGVTLITIFAARIGVMDQRIAANEYRHKEAFSAANAALDQGAAFIEQNPTLYTTTHDNWVTCSGASFEADFPCTVAGATTTDTYDLAYDANLITTNIIDPLDKTHGLSNVKSDTYIVFTTSASRGDILTVMGTGESADGTGQAIAQVAYAKHNILGIDKLPPVLAPVANLSGSFMIVADPQGKLIDGKDCADGEASFEFPVKPQDISIWTTTSAGANTGSWSTCLRGKFTNAGGEQCTEAYSDANTHTEWKNCTCDEDLSTSGGQDDEHIKYDIRVYGRNSTTTFPQAGNDPESPLDLIFGDTNPESDNIRGAADAEFVSGCPGITSHDFANKPFVYVDGDCSVGSIGTQAVPVFIVVNGDLTITSNSDIWGIVIGTGTVTFNGSPIVHGSVVSNDATKLTNGNYTQIFDWCINSNLIKAIDTAKLTKMKYSWRNFKP